MFSENDKKILDQVRQSLNPPTRQEMDDVTARWMFGKNAAKMMKYAPWSFVLMKLMWKKGEEPWAN